MLCSNTPSSQWMFLFLFLSCVSGQLPVPISEWLILVTQRLQCNFVLLISSDEEQDMGNVHLQRRLSEYGIFSVTAKLKFLQRYLQPTPRALHVLQGNTSDTIIQLSQMSAEIGLKGGPWLLLEVEDTLLDLLHLSLNSQVLVLKGTTYAVKLNEVYKLKPDGVLYSNEVGYWHRTIGLRMTRQLMYERRGQLHGLKMRVAVKNTETLTELKEGPQGTIELVGGFFSLVWDSLQKRMNISSEYITPKNPDERNGIAKMVLRDEADITFGDVTPTAMPDRKLMFTLPVLTFRYQVYIRRMNWQELPWDLYLKPFSGHLWLTVVFTMLLSALILTLVHRVGEYYGDKNCLDENQYSLRNSLFLVISAICQQGQQETPRALSCRTVFVVIYLTAVILLASYSAIFISFLTVQRTTLPFSDLQGLMDDGSYQIGVLINSTEHDLLKNSRNTLIRRLYNEFMEPDPKNFPDSDVAAFERVCNMKFGYMIPYEYMTMIQSNITCEIIALPMKYFELSLAFGLSRNSSFGRMLNYNLQVLRHGGLLQKMNRLTWSPREELEKRTWIHVRLKHTLSLLCVLAAGAVLSFVILGLEELHHKKLSKSKISVQTQTETHEVYILGKFIK